MPKALIITAEATSINIQARLLASLLVKHGFSVSIYRQSEVAEANRYSALMMPNYIIYFYDPSLYPIIPSSLRYDHIIFYWTVDGVPASPTQRSRVKSMCNMGINITNSEYSKANLEAIGCHVLDIIHNGIDWFNLSKHINDQVKYTFGVNAWYNYGGNLWYMDRKGYPALIGILHKLWARGLRFTAWIHSSHELLDFIGSRFNVTKLLSHVKSIYGILTISQQNYDSGCFFAINKEPDEKRPIKYTNVGSLMDIGEFYGSIRYYLMNSYVEGFGVPPIEALASGRFIIANDIPTWRELRQKYGLDSCSISIPIHATKQYMWGVGDNKLLMTFNIPDFYTWLNVLEDAVTRGINYDPVKCSELAKQLDYNNTYSQFLKYINIK